MSSKTAITCKCGGSVVMDLSDGLKLVAPSFYLAPGGAEHMVVDVLKGKGAVNPRYICVLCMTEYKDDAALSECTAQCRLCQREYKLKDLSVTSYVSPICDDCVTKSRKGDGKIAELFAAPMSFRTTPMTVVLMKKINQ